MDNIKKLAIPIDIVARTLFQIIETIIAIKAAYNLKFSIKKKFGTAVKRNKIKRRLKESIRRTNIIGGWDIVFIPRKNIKTKNYQQIELSIKNLLIRAGLLNKKVEI